jgi:hypothetical protein
MSPREPGQSDPLWALTITFGLVIILLCWAEPDPIVCPASNPAPYPDLRLPSG